ncbi:MAG: ECF transporter S component [Malacoplasma sp.]|nr:ECF transporter S component [Malacoplasma sp.]
MNKILSKKTTKQKIMEFFFPLYPLKVFSNISSITTFAVLIALRMILQLTSFYIPIFSFSISVSWTPLIIIGWLYGPVYGFVAGFVTDSLGILMSGSVWFWLYAIQEPMVGIIAGLFGYLCRLRLSKDVVNKKSKIIDFVIFDFFLIFFSGISIYFLIEFTKSSVSFEGKSKLEEIFFVYSKWIILGVMSFFLVFSNVLEIIFFKKFVRNFVFCSWLISLVCILSVLMSFLLGPISANEFYKYMYGNDSPLFIKYGVIFYLIPRVFKESIKAPIQVLILIIVIPIASNYIEKIKMAKFLKWNIDNKKT